MAATTVYKPATNDGNPAFLADVGRGRTPPVLVLADGTRIPGQLKSSNAESSGRNKWIFPPSILGQEGAHIEFGGETYPLINTSKAMEGTSPSNWADRGGKGDIGSVPGGFAPGNFNNQGFYPGYQGGNFPSPVTINYQPINPAPYKFTDPKKFAKEFGNLNRKEIAKNFELSQNMALGQLDTELKGLTGYAPAASALKRQETAVDNAFNQQQRTQQLQTAAPEIIGDLNAQAGRVRTYAEGGVPDSIGNKAFELGIRSRSADLASTGGFGTQSSIARKTSDLMSADRRIQLSQYGDQLLGQNVQLKNQLLLAPTEYSNAGNQINVMPSVSGSQLALQNQQEVNRNTILDPATALGQTVNQEQFKSNLVQDTSKFNASNTLNKDMFNATNANNFALTKFNYDVGYAGTVAGAAQTAANTQLALQQQQAAQQTFNDYLKQTQGANQIGAITQALAGIGTILNSLSNLFGGGSTSTPAASKPSGKAPGGGSGANRPSGGASSGSESSTPNLGSSDGISGGNDTGAVSSGVGDNPVGDTGDKNGGSSTETGLPPDKTGDSGDVTSNYEPPASPTQPRSLQARSASTTPVVTPTKQNPEDQKFLKQNNLPPTTDLAPAKASSEGLMRSVGFSRVATPNDKVSGFDSKGKPVYVNKALNESRDTTAGSQAVKQFYGILDPLGVFQPNDKTYLQKLSGLAGNAAFISDLNTYAQNKDYKGFATALVDKFKQPIVTAIAGDDSRKQNGVSALFGATKLAANWNQMSDHQKGLAIAHLGIQSYNYATGKDLYRTPIVKPTASTIGLDVGQALDLVGQGYNIYGLAQNWGKLNDVQKVIGGAQTVTGIAQTAKNLNMLGWGTNNAATALTAKDAAAIGFTSTPVAGIGAGTIPAGTAVPAGYTAVGSAVNGGTMIVPTANLASTSGAGLSGAGAEGSSAAAGPGALGYAAGGVSIASGAYTVYQSWGQGTNRAAVNGAIGGAAMTAGLYAMESGNVYVGAALIAIGAAGGLIKTGKSVDQTQRDGQRNLVTTALGQKGDYKIHLADGTTADIGIDGHGADRQFTNADKLLPSHKGLSQRAWDVDYTNDMDYAASMGGIALSRLLNGGTGKAIDQMGGQLTNAVLGSVGNGKEMSKGNFDTVMGNLRGVYSQAGIKSKSDMYALANQAYAEKRIDDFQLIQMHQAANMMYDRNGYDTAQKLMDGRWRGLEVAHDNEMKGQDQSQKPQTNPQIDKLNPDLDSGFHTRPVGAGKLPANRPGNPNLSQLNPNLDSGFNRPGNPNIDQLNPDLDTGFNGAPVYTGRQPGQAGDENLTGRSGKKKLKGLPASFGNQISY